MKKFLAAFLALMLLLGLSACDSGTAKQADLTAVMDSMNGKQKYDGSHGGQSDAAVRNRFRRLQTVCGVY